MGAVLSRSLSGISLPGGSDALALGGTALSAPVRAQFADALHRVFVAGAIVSAAGLFASLFLPSITFERVPAAAGEQMLQAEMTNLEPEDEPVAVPE